ncbi:jg24994 [Pararge aegeria aegeria]|uniref:Jg24994 protein n=1 Tax=Pararge aegeria aegeria TaxID=348720 RepID=A0A8S4QHF1_9NEOP|nr:jg24994 [Pararge aegeria aegeria]
MALLKILHRASEVFTKNAYIYNFQKLMFGPRSPSTITRSEEDLPIVTVERITIAPVVTPAPDVIIAAASPPFKPDAHPT